MERITDDGDEQVGDPEQVRVTVEHLLLAAGVDVPDTEVDRLAGLYPGLRGSVDKICAIDVGDEVQAAVFDAVDQATATGGAQ